MWQLIQKWHRTIGIIAALFVILLVITGLMLNHTDYLKMDESFVQNRLLLKMYNINPPTEPAGFPVNVHWISQVGERLYFNQKEIESDIQKLIGVVITEGNYLVAYDDHLLLLTRQGDVIERFGGAEGVPAGMRAIGTMEDNEVVIRGAHGDYLVDLDALHWHERDYVDADWSKPDTIPRDLLSSLLQLYRGKGLTLERVILDLHSGRIVGGFGVLLVDAMAILFFLLALSGIWMWFKRNRNTNSNSINSVQQRK